MDCNYNIDVKEPKEDGMLFHPTVSFRLVQLNPCATCTNDVQIDEQIKQLMENVKKLEKAAKKDLKGAIARHSK